MPTYVYGPKEDGKGCKYCKTWFEIFQRISEDPLANCPECGTEIDRKPTLFAFKKPQVVSDAYKSLMARAKEHEKTR